MTIRNAIPTFGMRSVVALVVLVVVALAALLAMGSPASAQVVGGKIWSATMVVGDFPIAKGWTPEQGGIGSLSDDSFSSGPNDHVLTVILERALPSKQILIGLTKKLNDNELLSMRLFVNGQAFGFDDATYATDATYGHVYVWPHDPLFGWTTGQNVVVKLLAEPVISIEAVTTQVEYKGIAEFKFTRYGITDQALSFNVNHVEGGSGADAELEFEAGSVTLTQYHWASETQSGGTNPWCSVSWQVRGSSHYFQGDPFFAMVDVEGPGSTCVGGG